MNKKESILYIVIFILFGVLFVRRIPQSEHYFFYSLMLWIGFGMTLVVSRYFVSRRISDKKYGLASIFTISTLTVFFLASGYFYCKYLADIFNVSQVSIFQMLVIKSTLSYLIVAFVIGLLHFVPARRIFTRKFFYYSGAGVVIVLIAFSSKYYLDTTYEGDDSVKFMESHPTLKAVLAQPQFSGKVVYVDLWFSSCAPCIEDFHQLPNLKKAISGKDIEYLYLARQTSHPNSFQLWKNAIKKHHLSGWHIYMSDELEGNVWSLIKENTEDLTMAYPHYLIVDKSNTIISYNAHRPSEGEALFARLRELAR